MSLCQQAYVLNDFSKKQLKNEMQFDGARAIWDGPLLVSNVISQKDSTGNSGSAAAAHLSNMAPVV